MRDARSEQLSQAMSEARNQTKLLLSRLEDVEQWRVPYLRIINPPLWELGHVGWFHEYWCLRWRGDDAPAPSILERADAWFDSRYVAHQSRWHLPLPAPEQVHGYCAEVLDRVQERLAKAGPDDDALYFFRLALFHEHMHIEAQAYTWQTIGRSLPLEAHVPRIGAAATEMIELPAGAWELGSRTASGFVFDNEKWAHEVRLPDYSIAVRPVSNAEFAAFVEDGGYGRADLWEPAYFEQMTREGRRMPLYWRSGSHGLERRHFDAWRPVPPEEPVLHVNAYEAQAYCRWAGGHLPSEAQWERAAMSDDRFQWGRFGWEWTSSPFEPFAGFSPDPYADYSIPAFGNTRVLRGGSYLTPRPLVHPKFRNYFSPERQDIFSTFRLCRS